MTEEARRPFGIVPAVVTPFDEQAEVAEEALAAILNHLIEAGVHGVFVCGSTGEYWALSPQEKQRIFEVTVATAKGRVPVFAGTGADTTALTVTLSQQAQEARADFVSVVTPSTIRPTDDELYEHYATIARNVDIPLVLYNNPARTGIHIAPSVAARLAEEFGNVVGIKDSSGDLTTTGEFIRLTPELFAVLAGRDTLIYPTLAMGGAGAIAATANIVPELVVRVYEEFRAGNLDAALEAQRRLAPLRLAFSLGTFPVVLKEAAQMIGLPAGPPRLPITPLTPQAREKLHTVLQTVGALRPT